MPQIGEPISVSEFINSDHSPTTCPWHQTGSQQKAKLPPTNADEDTDAMPPNDGGELGRNMRAENDNPPDVTSIWIAYKSGETLRYLSGKKKKKKEKVVQTYEKLRPSTEEEYALKYAPHHLIPGNESLKGSDIVPFMGDDESISNFANGQISYIEKGSVGYDVNSAKNGVWLPSPYALSNANMWPSEAGIKVIKRRRSVQLTDETEDFKSAYVAAAIEASGNRQFHMRHKDYSDKVREILKAIAERLATMAEEGCDIAKQKKNGKLAPPMGLPGRLNALSSNLRRLLIGPLWRDPIFTDKLTKEYANDLKEVKKKGQIRKVV